MSKPCLHIVMLEDDLFDAELNKEQVLSINDYDWVIHLATDKQSYLDAIVKHSPDIILSDYNLPSYNGLQALDDLKSINSLIPFIFVTGATNEETSAHAIRAGAWDYVVKDRLFRLPLAIQSVLKVKTEKELAAKAEEKTERLLMAIEQTSSQILVSDNKNKIVYVNKRFTEITGYELEDVIGKDAIEISVLDTEEVAIIKNHLKLGIVFKGEVCSKAIDGTVLWELLSITPIKNNRDEITNYVSIKEDITLRKKMEQDLIDARDEAERSNKLKEAFLQNMSHEVRTPLNAIVGFSDLLNKTKDITRDTINYYTNIIATSSNQLLSIVSDILTVSSIETGQLRLNQSPVNISEMLKQLDENYSALALKKELNFTITYNYSDQELIVNADNDKLNQAISKLLNNAFKFTAIGGVTLKCMVSDDRIGFEVKDTGIGIKSEDIELIFERFRQASDKTHTLYGGTGLGLSIAKSFIVMMGGEISASSEVNVGSEFRFWIPCNPIKPKTDKTNINSYNDHHLHVLVAEDEDINFILLETYFEPYQNIVLHHAKNGQQAIDMYLKIPDIKIILMDIRMPVLDGIGALNAIRKIDKNIPIIAQTAYSSENDKNRLLSIGFTDCMLKPLKADLVINKIKSLHIEN